MTDNEIIKALECCCIEHACSKCHYSKTCSANCINEIMRDTLDLINSQKAQLEKKDTEIDILIRKKETLSNEISELRAEIERVEKLQKPTETSGFHIKNGNIIFYANILNGYRYEYKNLDEVVKELNLMLHQNYSSYEIISHYKGKLETAKTEIERLQSYNENLLTANTALPNEILDIKTEAYKEFAERLQAMFEQYATYDTLHIYEIIDRIDIVLEELTEGNGNE